MCLIAKDTASLNVVSLGVLAWKTGIAVVVSLKVLDMFESTLPNFVT